MTWHLLVMHTNIVPYPTVSYAVESNTNISYFNFVLKTLTSEQRSITNCKVIFILCLLYTKLSALLRKNPPVGQAVTRMSLEQEA